MWARLGGRGSTSDGLRQVGSPTKRRAPLQGDMVHLADQLRANVPWCQHQPDCAGDVVGSAVSLWVHGGLGGWERIPIFEPFQGYRSGGEAVGLTGEAHCLLRRGPPGGG